jgi:5-methylcytosine-specific restriction endonuclease McrA
LREDALNRDGRRCRACEQVPTGGVCALDPHHITPREKMPNGGYVLENIVTLCPTCHRGAEAWLSGDRNPPAHLHPLRLYMLIGSGYLMALAADEAARG